MGCHAFSKVKSSDSPKGTGGGGAAHAGFPLENSGNILYLEKNTIFLLCLSGKSYFSK